MSSKDSTASTRQCSIESGLTHAIAPVGLLCGIPERDLKSQKAGPDHLTVPNTPASKMAKMKKKMHSPLSRRKSTSSEPSELSVNSSKIFGVSLDEAIKHHQGPVPWVVVRIVDYLLKHGMKNEGIFRVSGNKKNVDLMKAAFDRDGDVDLEEVGDVMAVAGLLKQYLRDLPEPPIPQSLTQDFIKIHIDYGDDNPECLHELKDLLGKLPELNYRLVKYLCSFLVGVAEYEENNKMSCMALAIVFGPNLFRCKDGLEGLKEQGHTNAIVCKFLQDYEKLFPDDDEVSPYATTELFIQTPRSPDAIDASGPSYSKAQESSTSDEELGSSNKTTVEISIHGKLEPVYACIDKNKKHLAPSASSSSEDLDLYVRSVSPSLWNSNGSNGNNSPSTTSHQHHGPQGRDMVQKVIKDSIKEHLFGPDDDNEYSPNESVHSSESLEEIIPPLPARNYGPEDTNRPQVKRRRNAKKQQNGSNPSTSRSELTIDVSAVDSKKDFVITLDQNSNSILKVQNQQDGVGEHTDGDDVTKVKRNSGILTTLTKNRAPPPSNRRSPSLKRNSQPDLDDEEAEGYGELPEKFVHPLVVEAKSRGKISTPPPRSPRSSPRVSKSPPSLSPNKHATVDEVDGGYNPVKELSSWQYKKRGRGPPGVPPLELYKLQQVEGDDYSDNVFKYDVQLSPRERYDGLSADEALPSPRSRPLAIDTKSYPTECPPSPPHDHIEPFWSDRRMDVSPKGELSLKQISRNIHQLKKKIREYEEAFELEHGHKPSQSEKGPIKKYLADLNRYRKELKELKEKAKEDSERLIETAPALKQVLPTTINSAEPLLTTTPATVQQSLDNILRKLQDKRKAVGRSEDLQVLTFEELQDEKLCVQKALLQHESVFGRPTTKKDKDVMRPLYDRYRMIKKKISASRTQSSTEDLSNKSGGKSTEHDDMGSEEQLFATLTLLPKSKMSPLSKDLTKAQKRRSDVSCVSTDDLDSDFGGSQENLLEDKERDTKLHHMSQEDLQKQVELARRDKKRLRKKLKKFEDDFLERTGRRVQRDERGEMEDGYREYKQIKARLRLIDVLLAKRQASSTI